MPDLSEIEIGLMGPRQAGYQVRPHQAHKEAQQLSQALRLVYISKCFLGLMLKYTNTCTYSTYASLSKLLTFYT
jgi:hypothetical protein